MAQSQVTQSPEDSNPVISIQRTTQLTFGQLMLHLLLKLVRRHVSTGQQEKENRRSGSILIDHVVLPDVSAIDYM